MKRLVTSSAGFISLSDHSAWSIVTPYLPSCSIFARRALPDHALPMVLCQSVSIASGSGTQARAVPKASLISTRVTVSEVRQPASAASAKRCGRAEATDAAVAGVGRGLRGGGLRLGGGGHG